MAAAERRLDARLEETAGVLASIREFADELEGLRRSVSEAAEFTSDTKAATAVLQAQAGNQIAGLKEGRRELDEAVAALGSRTEGLKAREDALGKGVGELRGLWTRAGEMLERLASKTGSLADRYRDWTEGSEALGKEMATLSGVLLQGDARMAESVSRNAEAQEKLSAKTLGIVERFAGENDRLLERVGAAREDFVDALRAEAGRARRWTVPALAAAHRKDMAALARVIRDGDAGMRESVANNAEAQLELSLKTLANVEKFGNENDRFLKRFQAGGEELLDALRGEAAGIRRWVAPSLSAALVAVGLSFPVLGAWTQSRLGMFEAYDGTRVVPFAAFAMSENTSAFLPVFRNALIRRGLPQRLYVDNGTHRLRLAGCELPLFEPPAVEALFQSARGLPRQINRIAHYALSAAALDGARTVNAEHLQNAIEELAP